jgi:hypothetical protein
LVRIEGRFGEFRTVDGPIVIQYGFAKMSNHFIVDRLARLHEFVGDVVGLNDTRAQSNKHFADHGFAAGDSPGQADFQQRNLAGMGSKAF